VASWTRGRLTPQPGRDYHCPVPAFTGHAEIQVATAGGGRLSPGVDRGRVFRPGPLPTRSSSTARHDGAILEVPPGARLAFTTDFARGESVVFPRGAISGGSRPRHRPTIFPRWCGARPRWLKRRLYSGEGLPLEVLEHVVRSMGDAARAAGVVGSCHRRYQGCGGGKGRWQYIINTSGIGVIEHAALISHRRPCGRGSHPARGRHRPARHGEKRAEYGPLAARFGVPIRGSPVSSRSTSCVLGINLVRPGRGGERLRPSGAAGGKRARATRDQEVFTVVDRNWRGIGRIPSSGPLALKP